MVGFKEHVIGRAPTPTAIGWWIASTTHTSNKEKCFNAKTLGGVNKFWPRAALLAVHSLVANLTSSTMAAPVDAGQLCAGRLPSRQQSNTLIQNFQLL
jgi:hypothetical protein